MLNRSNRFVICTLCFLLLLPIMASAAPQEAAQTTDVRTSLSSLQSQIEQLAAERSAALDAVQARLSAAAPSERTAIEAEGARLTEEYEIAYLMLAIQYHELSGNEVERVRAERMLAALQNPQAGMVPVTESQELPRVESGEEGVLIDAQ